MFCWVIESLVGYGITFLKSPSFLELIVDSWLFPLYDILLLSLWDDFKSFNALMPAFLFSDSSFISKVFSIISSSRMSSKE